MLRFCVSHPTPHSMSLPWYPHPFRSISVEALRILIAVSNETYSSRYVHVAPASPPHTPPLPSTHTHTPPTHPPTPTHRGFSRQV